MDAAELEHWQSSLPTDRDELGVMLEQLQTDWMEAQAALIPAVKLGNGYLIQQVVTTLAQQIQIIEAVLVHAE
ncbi:hypothetical protein E7T09_08815 [Deinococcus sp. KSM4-11]|uniref:hypothetical protein n=1 Tax=Deinococcus sp. KSM4-11 TaxID=2568654 RepID=UPI0010A55AA3|nr:hypothetical protein [Deinococcus sp. KSM4-11]THF87237.1 hypothetical protein E7T09_08815 [Deinococcus sp. KSM4-11]